MTIGIIFLCVVLPLALGYIVSKRENPPTPEEVRTAIERDNGRRIRQHLGEANTVSAAHLGLERGEAILR